MGDERSTVSIGKTSPVDHTQNILDRVFRRGRPFKVRGIFYGKKRMISFGLTSYVESGLNVP